MKKMNAAVITGATSTLGVATIKELLSHNVKVYALVRGNSPKLANIPKSSMIELIDCDLQSMKDFMPSTGQKADAFYHFAWGSTDKTIRDNPLPQLDNLRYEIDAVNLADRFGCKIFVGAGSQAEYGVTQELITEETRVDPVTSYGVAKYAGGKLTRKLCAQLGMNCIWPRIFSVFGEGESLNTMLSYAIKCTLTGEKACFSAATNDWDYLYKSDLARWFYLLAEKDCPAGVYNIASGKNRMLKEYILELATVIQQETGKRLEYEFSSDPLSGFTPYLRCDVSKVISVTGYEPEVSFAEGIKKLIPSVAEAIK